MSPEKPLFRKLDNHLLRVADLDAAISFYRDRLGHQLLWRSDEAAGFGLPETDAELVVHLHIGPETDILVADVDEAFAAFLKAGGESILAPFDIAIGRCARIRDPFGLGPARFRSPTTASSFSTNCRSSSRRFSTASASRSRPAKSRSRAPTIAWSIPRASSLWRQ